MKQCPENLRRAVSASQALRAYRLANVDDVDDVDDASPSDLISDLGHYADRHAIDFPAIVAIALRAWASERKTKGKPRLAVRIHIGAGGEP